MPQLTKLEIIENYIIERSNGRLDYHTSLLNDYKGFLGIENDLDRQLNERLRAPDPRFAVSQLIEDLKFEVFPGDDEDYVLTHAYRTAMENRSWTLEFFFYSRTPVIPSIEDIDAAAQAVDYAYFIRKAEDMLLNPSLIESETPISEEEQASFAAYTAWMHELGIIEPVLRICNNDIRKAGRILTEISNYNFRSDTLRTYVRGIFSNDNGNNNPFTAKSFEYIEKQKKKYKIQ